MKPISSNKCKKVSMMKKYYLQTYILMNSILKILQFLMELLLLWSRLLLRVLLSLNIHCLMLRFCNIPITFKIPTNCHLQCNLSQDHPSIIPHLSHQCCMTLQNPLLPTILKLNLSSVTSNVATCWSIM